MFTCFSPPFWNLPRKSQINKSGLWDASSQHKSVQAYLCGTIMSFLARSNQGRGAFLFPHELQYISLPCWRVKDISELFFFYDCVRVSAWSRRCWSYLDKKIQSVGKVAAIVHWIHISHHFVERRKFSVSVNMMSILHLPCIKIQFWLSSQGFSVLTSSCRWKKM